MRQDEDLLSLLNRLIIQRTYKENVCLTEAKSVDYVIGEVLAEEEELIKQHLNLCVHCRKSIDMLRKAAEDFDRISGEIWLRIEGKLGEHISEPLLYSYVHSILPSSPAGTKLLSGVQSHLRGCDYCRERAQGVAAARDGSLSIRYSDIHHSKEKALRAGEIFLALSALVSLTKAVRARRFHGTRGATEVAVEAPLLDQDGLLSLDSDGKPRYVRFGLLRSEISKDGLCMIDMSTADQELFESKAQHHIVTTSLAYESTNIILPEEKIHSDGRVTIAVRLGISGPVRHIPAQAIRLVVSPEKGKDFQLHE